MLSLVDVLLGRPIEEIVRELRLGPDIALALIDHESELARLRLSIEELQQFEHAAYTPGFTRSSRPCSPERTGGSSVMLISVFTGLLVISAAIVLAVASQRRFIAGYPVPPPGLAVLHRGEAAFIQAVAEVLFPDGASLPIVGAEAQLPLYVDRHLAALPAAKRLQIRALLLLFEHLSLVLPAQEPGGRDRFSSLSATARLAVLERVASHRDARVRLLFTALRAIVALGYLGHPSNLGELSLAPFEIEPAVSDAELLFPRVGALPMSIRYEAADRTDPAARGPLDPKGPRHRAYQPSSRDPR